MMKRDSDSPLLFLGKLEPLITALRESAVTSKLIEVKKYDSLVCYHGSCIISTSTEYRVRLYLT